MKRSNYFFERTQNWFDLLSNASISKTPALLFFIFLFASHQAVSVQMQTLEQYRTAISNVSMLQVACNNHNEYQVDVGVANSLGFSYRNEHRLYKLQSVADFQTMIRRLNESEEFQQEMDVMLNMKIERLYTLPAVVLNTMLINSVSLRVEEEQNLPDSPDDAASSTGSDVGTGN